MDYADLIIASLLHMTNPDYWIGDTETKNEGVQKAHGVIGMLLEECETVTIPIGTIVPFAGDTPPAGWLICNGQQLAKDDYPELYDICDQAYGFVMTPDTSFRVPDLRNAFVRGHAGAIDNLGDAGGNASTTLTTANLPAHTHDYTLRTTLQNVRGTSAGGITTAAVGTAETSSVGSATPFSNEPPYLVLAYIIKAL